MPRLLRPTRTTHFGDTLVHDAIDPATGEGKHRWKSGFATESQAQRAMREAISATEQGTFKRVCCRSLYVIVGAIRDAVFANA